MSLLSRYERLPENRDKRYSHVLFDLDNTLTDRDKAVRLLASNLFDSASLNRETISRADALDVFLSNDHNYYGEGRTNFFQQIRMAWRPMRRTPKELAEWYRSAPREWYVPDPSIIQFLKRISSSEITWGIVTNGPPTQLEKVQRLGLIEGSSCILVSEIIGKHKPSTSIFIETLSHLNASCPDDVLFVGDDPIADIEGARNTGMGTAWITRGRKWPVDLLSPTFSVRSVLDIWDILDIK